MSARMPDGWSDHVLDRFADSEHCNRCGRRYFLVWEARGDLWERVTGRSGGLLCPDCFTDVAAENGIFVAFVCIEGTTPTFEGSGT